MASYCFMSTEKVKSLTTFNRKMVHNYRLGSTPNADPDRACLNQELIKLQYDSYSDAFKKIMDENKHVPRKNAVMGIEVVMTYNAREVDDDFDLTKWQEENVKWLKETFGEKNVISAMYHGDEGIEFKTGKDGKVLKPGSGHIHAMVIPMVDGKLNAKSFLSGRQKLIEMQDSYGKAMEPLGLKRGLKGSTAKHQDIRLFYDELNKELDKKLPQVEKGETAQEYRERADEIYRRSNLQHLEETKKLQRAIVEAETFTKNISFEDKLEFNSETSRLEEEKKKIEIEKKRLKKEKNILNKLNDKDEETFKKLKSFDLIIDGLTNYPDREYAKKLGHELNQLSKWQNDYEKGIINIRGKKGDGQADYEKKNKNKKKER